MTYRPRLSIFVLMITLAASAQVASHKPTMPAAVRPQTAAVSEKPVVRVNGAVLTDHDLLRQMLNAFPYARVHGGKFPAQLEPGIRKTALHDIEFEELVYQYAVRQKMTVAPAKLQSAMTAFKKNFNSTAEYQAYLGSEFGGSIDKLREKVRRAILIDQVLTAEVTQKSRVSPAELRSFYNRHPERFRKPESVSIQTISLGYGQSATPKQKADALKRAQEALKQAKATKNYEEFGLLAEKVSEDDWHVMMGDRKSIHRGRMPARIEKVAFSLKPGQVSDIIDAGEFYCIIRVNAREDSKLVSFEEVRAQLKKDLESDNTEQLRSKLDARLRVGAKIEEL